MLDGKRFHDPSIIFVSIESHQYFAVSNGSQDLFHFDFSHLEGVKSEDFIVEILLNGKVFLFGGKKAFPGWKYSFDKKQVSPFVPDQESIRVGVGKAALKGRKSLNDFTGEKNFHHHHYIIGTFR